MNRIEQLDQAIAQAKEAYASKDRSAIDAAISILAAWVVKEDLNPSQKSEAENLKAKLLALRSS